MNTLSRPSRGSTASAVRTIASSAGGGGGAGSGRGARLGDRIGLRDDRIVGRLDARQRCRAAGAILRGDRPAAGTVCSRRMSHASLAQPSPARRSGSDVAGGCAEPALEGAHHAGARRRHRTVSDRAHRRSPEACLLPASSAPGPRRRPARAPPRCRAAVATASAKRFASSAVDSALVVFARDQRRVAPHRLAVAPPVERERPARHRLARVPFAEPVMQQALRRESFAQAARQLVRQHALRLARAPRRSIRATGDRRPTRRSARRPS